METKRTAFTLTEVLVVVAIIGLLVAGVVGVAGYVKTQSKIALTKQCVQLLSVATAEFYDVTGHYPVDDWNTRNSVGSRIAGAFASGGKLPGQLEDPDPDNPDPDPPATSDLLYLQLSLLPDSQKIVAKIPETMLVLPPADSATVYLRREVVAGPRPSPTPYLRPIKDPWGNFLDYQISTGFPKIRSWGPDKERDTADDIHNKN